jgi:hypothetical protein
MVGAAACAYACSIYDTSLLLPGPGGDTDAEVDGAPGDGGAEGDPCDHARPPAHPSGADKPDGVDFVVAARTLDFGLAVDAGAPPPMGLDLDGVCTCPPPESCLGRVANATHCDEDGGRDNGTGALLRSFAQISDGIINQESVNKRLERGDYSMLFRVRHYNGQADDPAVEVSTFLSNGVEQPSPDAGVVPKWDGTDRFTIDTGSVFGGSGDGGVIPNYVDTKAYVAGSVLVTTIDQVPLFLGSSGLGFFTMRLTNVTFVLRLVPEGATFRVSEGVAAGRWRTKELLAIMGSVPAPFGPGYICPGTQLYDDAKQLICKNADIAADPKNDRAGMPCEALSIGFLLTASPVVMGSLTANATSASNCDAGADDCN